VPGVPDNAHPAKVLNMSLGDNSTTVTPCSSTVYPDAVSQVLAHNAVIVVAAGNGNGHALQPPGNCSGVITVAGVRHIGTKVGFSDIGPEVSLAAPGGNCVNLSGACVYPIMTTVNLGSTVPGANGYSDAFAASLGTSFATPLVAGTAALMLSANPSLTPAQVRSILMQTARVFPFRGAQADTSGPVPMCTAPSSADQSQCYCTTTTCGAGILSTARAVYAAANSAPQAKITTSGAATPGTTLSLASDTSVAASGRTIVSEDWHLIDGGGIIAAFDTGSTNASGPAVAVAPTAAGMFSVRLTVTDSAGVQGISEKTFTISDAPTPTPTPTPTPAPSGGGSSGGGAMSWAWLAALAAATLALRRGRRA
jgi:serine protease